MVWNPFLVILIPLASEMTLWTHSNEETRSDAGGHKSSSVAPGYRRETFANPGQPRRQEQLKHPPVRLGSVLQAAITNNLPTKLGIASLVWAGSTMGNDTDPSGNG
jgi:hypothetical protein